MKSKRITIWRTLSQANDFRPDDPKTEAVAHPWASLEPKTGDESETADQQQGTTNYTIKFRWGVSLAAMDSSYWATWKDAAGNEVRFEFASVVNVDEANQWFEIQAVRV